jgi:putative solute:sodium symporter small subunit
MPAATERDTDRRLAGDVSAAGSNLYGDRTSSVRLHPVSNEGKTMRNVCRWDHWTRFKNLMLVMFGLWLAFFFIINTFAKALEKILVPGLELPLSIYMPIQAALIVFAVTLFWLARVTREARLRPIEVKTRR